MNERETRRKSSVRVIRACHLTNDRVILIMRDFNSCARARIRYKSEGKREMKREMRDDGGSSEYMMRVCYRAN